MHDKKMVKTIQKQGLGVSGSLVLHAQVYIPMNKQKVENVTGVAKTRNNGMLHFRLYVGNRVSRVMVSRKYFSQRSKILKKRIKLSFNDIF